MFWFWILRDLLQAILEINYGTYISKHGQNCGAPGKSKKNPPYNDFFYQIIANNFITNISNILYLVILFQWTHLFHKMLIDYIVTIEDLKSFKQSWN